MGNEKTDKKRGESSKEGSDLYWENIARRTDSAISRTLGPFVIGIGEDERMDDGSDRRANGISGCRLLRLLILFLFVMHKCLSVIIFPESININQY